MADFFCRLGNTSGEIIERTYTADSEAALRRELERKDFLVISMRKAGGVGEALRGLLPFRPRVKVKEFLLFNQEFMALIRAGLPILSSLDILIERRKNPVFKRALTDIRDRVKSGESLSEAFMAQGELFPKLYGSSVASGERSGEVATVLKRYVTYTRTMMAIRKKVVGAMIYPMILMTLSIALVGVLVYYVLPTFTEFYKGLGGKGTDLPLITAVLVMISNFVRGNVVLIVFAVMGTSAVFQVWRKTDTGRYQFDSFKLQIPLVGGVLKSYAVSRFARTLSTLVSGGIPLVSALEITAQSIGSAVYGRALDGVTRRVQEGEALWDSLEKTHLFGDMTTEMIKVGESTGALEEMLTNVSDFLDEEIDQKLTTMVALVEPLMLVFMAFLVGAIMLAIYYPLLKLYSGSAAGA